MAGVFTTEGLAVIQQRLWENVTTDRTGLVIGLFTNSSGLDASSTLSSLTVPTAQGSYAEVSLVDGTWTVSGGVASYPAVEFLADGADLSSDIYGYYIATTGATARLVAFEVEGSATTVESGNTYKVTPSLSMVDGVNGITTDEGIQVLLDLFFKSITTNRTANLKIGLFQNTGTLPNSTVLATMTPPTLGGYAAQDLTDTAWTITDADAVYDTNPEWTASGADYETIYGYYIYTNGATPKLLAIDNYASAPIIVVDGATYDVDLTNTAD